ncbi:MAG TPA: sugar ABC transporter permease [Galbitalea sp.]
MTQNPPLQAETPTGPTDLQDERLLRPTGFSGNVRAALKRIRTGDLGSLPVVIGLIIIWTIFQIMNPVFLSSNNIVNLMLQAAPIGVIAIGVVLVLLLGQIDLSVGSVSGLTAAVIGVGLTKAHWPEFLAIVVALVVGVAIGLLYGLLFARFGVPSFVITLAGLLGFLGLQLAILGPDGSINIPYSSFLVTFEQIWFVPPPIAIILAILTGVAVAAVGLIGRRKRAAAGLSAASLTSIFLKAGALLVALVLVVIYLDTDRGVGASFLFFIVLVVAVDYALTRTKWGRSVFAVGGNVEAARRAGIRVNRIYVGVFVLSGVFAVLGGLLAAGRGAVASLQSGTGDVNLDAIAAAVIGGTSLFGGRGSAYSALLGIIVIQSISSGLTLLSLDSSVRYMITGAVLLLAVIVDSLSRRSRVAAGRA